MHEIEIRLFVSLTGANEWSDRSWRMFRLDGGLGMRSVAVVLAYAGRRARDAFFYDNTT
jgi:hypothetical protein